MIWAGKASVCHLYALSCLFQPPVVDRTMLIGEQWAMPASNSLPAQQGSHRASP